jgi:glycosyltransferase involved in cell wall biosynthesis
MEVVYFIERYDRFKKDNIGTYSGYHQIVKYSSNYKRIKGNRFLNSLLKRFLVKIHKPGYLFANSSKEISGMFRDILKPKTRIHYLYADKDALILPLLRSRLNLKRIELIGSFHWPVQPMSKAEEKQEAERLQQFKKAIILGPQLYDHYAKYIPSVRFIPHGIDTDYWKKSSRISEKEKYRQAKNILIIGESNRDHEAQARLMRVILEYDNNVSFTVLIKRQEVLQHYTGIENTVINDGYLNDDDFKALYEGAFAVLLIQENCLGSNVVLESMSLGIPLITNNTGDIGVYLGDEYDLYIDRQLTLKHKLLWNDPDYYRNTSNYLLERSKFFSWDIVAKQTMDFVLE